MGNSYINNTSNITNKKIHAVVDCNNFFVSCELLFAPHYQGKPVVVLSNNDGCVVSRSNEAKSLGIPMGAPAFKYESVFQRSNTKIFSANFRLYGDISNRVMKIIKDHFSETHIYSIDEAFIDLSGFSPQKALKSCRALKRKIEKWTGIPISIGIASTKTLAKVAIEIAKKNPKHNGVLSFVNIEDISLYLKRLDVKDVWGIGRALGPKLKNFGITNAYQLRDLDDKLINRFFNVNGRKTVLELNEIDCTTHSVESHKSIISSRSFGKPVSKINELKEAVSQYVSKASRKLRKNKLIARTVGVYIVTNYHKKNQPQYRNSTKIKLLTSTDYTPTLIKAAIKGLEEIYKPGYLYKKAGIVLLDIRKNDDAQYSYLENKQKKREDKKQNYMKIIDKINNKWGSYTMKTLSEGIKKSWKMRSQQKSKAYTTSWDEILKIKI